MQAIEEKLRAIKIFFQKREISEQAAIVSTILVFVLILLTFFLIVAFVLPKTKVEINISGPDTIKAGEEATYQVTYKNTGNVALKNPELVFYFPSSSLPEKSLVENIKLGEDLYPGQVKSFDFKAQFFGQENEVHEMKAWVDFSTEKDSKMKMSEVAYFSTSISEVPIDLVLDIPQKIPVSAVEDPDFTFRIRYFSTENIPRENLKLAVNLPEGFSYQRSIPDKKDIEDAYEFNIPILDQTGRGEVEITGSFPEIEETGQNLDFNVDLFFQVHGNNILLKRESVQTITYEPNLIFSQKINNRKESFPYMGEKLHYEIYFKNIKEEALRDLSLATILEGNFFDLSTIEAPLGTFSQGGHSISWSGEKVDRLKYLTPGEEGKVEFWVNLKDDYLPENLNETNAFIRNRIVLAGFETEFRARVNSLAKIDQEAYFKDAYGFFENEGKHPPRVGETTYYTIVWKLENYYNPIKDVAVRAFLPEGVSFRSVKTSHGELSVLTGLEQAKLYPEIPDGFSFKNVLYQGLNNNEVKYLQLILRKEVPAVYPQDALASGYFGPITLQSLKSFQEKYREEILVPQDAQDPTGVFDELTRNKLNELLAEEESGSSEVIWRIDNVEPGIGVWQDSLVAAFQIAFTPDSSHRQKIANLVNKVSFTATDQWTGLPITGSEKALDTSLPHDRSIGFMSGSGKVQ